MGVIMYPHNFFTLFPPFPRENIVFVAMSFDSKFDKRWEDLIIPAIRSTTYDGKPLKQCRVDISIASDSIITDILNGIGNCYLFFADLTSIGYLEEKGEERKAIRNGNVMYEVGIAQSTRLPEEVILFRSDDDPLLFDVANVRVNYYNPDENPLEAKTKVEKALSSAIKEINLQKHFSVIRTVDALDITSCTFIVKSFTNQGQIPIPEVKKEHAISIQRLLELGIIKTQFIELTPEMGTMTKDEEIVSYNITPFGAEAFKEIIMRMNLISR
jgi:hypothetical protein